LPWSICPAVPTMTDFICDSIDGGVWSGRHRPLPLIWVLSLIATLRLAIEGQQQKKSDFNGSGQKGSLHPKSACEKFVEMRQ
jgi:hypothetical protein